MAQRCPFLLPLLLLLRLLTTPLALRWCGSWARVGVHGRARGVKRLQGRFSRGKGEEEVVAGDSLGEKYLPPQYNDGKNSSFLTDLNDEQRAAVTAPLSNIRVVAGPGSGKTRVLISRILYLVETLRTQPRNILAVTFTKKASTEMLSRINKYYSNSSSSSDNVNLVTNKRSFTVTTLHSFCAFLLRLNAKHSNTANGAGMSFSIFDEGDTVKIINRLLKTKDLLKVYKSRQICDYISILKREGFSYRSSKEEMFDKSSVFVNAKGSNGFKENIASLFTEYNIILKENDALDFDDIIIEALNLVKADGYITRYVRGRYNHILVDEFQDIDNVQFELLRLLRGSGSEKSLFVVGDPDQTIYSWRGASPRFMTEFSENFDDAQSHVLANNYRSTANIIKTFRHFIAKDTKDSSSSPALPTSLLPTPDLAKEESSVKIVNAYNDEAQADYVAHMVDYLLSSGEIEDASEIAVMYRKHSLSLAIETSLLARAVPYTIVGDIAVTDRKEVKDALAYLRLLTNPRDIESMKRVINYPPRGVGAATQQKLFDFIDSMLLEGIDSVDVSDSAGEGYKSSLPPILDLVLCLGGMTDDADVLFNSNDMDSVTKMKSIRELIESEDFSNKQLKSLKVASEAFYELDQAVVEWQGTMEELVVTIFTKSGLIKYITDKAKTEKEKKSRLANLYALVELARRFDRDMGSYADPEELMSYSSAFNGLERLKLCLDSFLLSSDLIDDDAGLPAAAATSGGAVRLLSLHASKGLEFKVVFIVGLEEGVLPSIASLNSGVFRSKKKKRSEAIGDGDGDGDGDDIDSRGDGDVGDVGNVDDSDADSGSYLDSDLEEEKRLLYVGMTRARERLFLLYRSRYSIDKKRSTPAQPSSFLSLIPTDTPYEVYINRRQ